MKPEIKYDSQMLIDMAEKIIDELSFMQIISSSQRNEIAMALTVAYKHGKADGFKEAMQLIRNAM